MTKLKLLLTLTFLILVGSLYGQEYTVENFYPTQAISFLTIPGKEDLVITRRSDETDRYGKQLSVITKFKGSVISAETRYYFVKDNKVLVNTVLFHSILGDENQMFNSENPWIELILPPVTGTVSWETTSLSGDRFHCVASFADVKFERGRSVKSIKVIKTTKNGNDVHKSIEYYLYGIGLSQIDAVEKSGKITTAFILETP